ncbi:hypothetical protein [Mycobacterium terramassiliense]|uniref:hypothetical protein n=1 Tax=Mycobacterium terramassiliense TaxID=1841859 RepID=UPI0012FF783F|nr:hypothetical protein [Mycobacterium terramassiliense]
MRTAEGHIYSACVKLDVADRDDLAVIVSATPEVLDRVRPAGAAHPRRAAGTVE